MIKYSRQRESIVNFLASRTDHPTAETIYQNIKKEFPKKLGKSVDTGGFMVVLLT